MLFQILEMYPEKSDSFLFLTLLHNYPWEIDTFKNILDRMIKKILPISTHHILKIDSPFQLLWYICLFYIIVAKSLIKLREWLRSHVSTSTKVQIKNAYTHLYV